MISVIIPLFNGEKTIINTLESVRKQETQENFEIIVINDGSTDNGEKLVKEYSIQNPQLNIILLNQENKGVSAARNAGLKIVKGDFIALLDADDEWLPKKTERQLKFLKNENLQIDFIGSERNGLKIKFPYKTRENDLAEVTFRKLLIRNEVLPSTVIFKRKTLDNTGFFDDAQRYAEDVNYWLKVSKNNKMYILGESLVIAGGGKRSFGVSGLSANLKEMDKGYRKNLREMNDLGRIGNIELLFYQVFYKLKYFLLLMRSL